MLIYAYNFFSLSIQLISVSDYVRDTVTFPSDRRLSRQARRKLAFYGRTTYLPCKFRAKASQLFLIQFTFFDILSLQLRMSFFCNSRIITLCQIILGYCPRDGELCLETSKLFLTFIRVYLWGQLPPRNFLQGCSPVMGLHTHSAELVPH